MRAPTARRRRRTVGAPRRWSRRRPTLRGLSLRARLVAVVTGLLLLALALVSAVTLAVLHRVLIDQVDDDLRSTTSSASSLQSVADASAPDQGYPSDYVLSTYDSSGNLLYAGLQPPGSHHGPLVLRGVTRAWAAAHTRPTTVRAASGGLWRVVAQRQAVGGEGVVTVVVARSLDDVGDSVRTVATWLLVVGVGVVGAGALLGTGAITRAFRPLRQVEAVAESFGSGEVSHRVTVTAPGTEVGRLGSAVNAMLDRIGTSLAAREASEARMRQFVADASHELRTPLAAVRGYAELHRLGATSTPEAVAGAFTRIETEATRLGRLVEDLLTLARLDEARPLRTDPVDLLPLLADARADARALAPDREVRLVGLDGAPLAPVFVTGDEAALRQVVTNLVANAVRHTPAGTPVELGVGVAGPWGRLAVIDHGPGIAAADAPRVFERFWRADASRQRATGGGSGLGTSIAAGIVAAHDGRLRGGATPGGGATFEVALPLAGEQLPGAGLDDPDEQFDEHVDDSAGPDGDLRPQAPSRPLRPPPLRGAARSPARAPSVQRTGPRGQLARPVREDDP